LSAIHDNNFFERNKMKLFTKNGKSTKQLADLLFALTWHTKSAEGNLKYTHIAHLCTSSKRGVQATHDHNLADALRQLNIPFVSGNDAPRGGAVGNYINFNYYAFLIALIDFDKQ